MIEPFDYEFYVGRHLNTGKFQQPGDLQKKGLILRQQFLIDQKKKLDQISQSIKQSCYEINISNLQTSKLMSNLKFKNLVGLIEEHNKMIRIVKQGKAHPHDLIIQCEFNKELEKLLNQVLQFTTPESQLEYLEQVNQWSLKARNIKPTTSMKQSNLSEIRNIPEIKMPPSLIVQQEMIQFVNGTRTWHKDIDPVKERLKAYNYRKLISQISTADTTMLPISNAKRTFPITYPKLDFLSPPIEQHLQAEEDQIVSNLLAGRESANDEAQIDDEEQQSQDNQSSKIKKKSVSLAPDKKYFIRDSVSTRPTSLQRDYENKSIFLNYVPDNQNIEISLQKRWLFHQKYEQSQKKEDQEMIQMMNQYVKTKSRIEKEINRKIDSKIQGSAYQKIYKSERLEESQRDKIFNSIFEDIEKQSETQGSMLNLLNNQFYQQQKLIIGLNQLRTNRQGPKKVIDHSLNIQQHGQTERIPENYGSQISSARVKNLIKFNQNILNLSVDDQTNQIIKPHSLSVYEKASQELNSINRPLSVVYQKSNTFIQDELKEVLDVKQRLAKYRIVVPTKKLVNSLVTPMNRTFDGSSYGDKDIQIPQPGYGISPNPFEEEGKKQTKNKKKR